MICDKILEDKEFGHLYIVVNARAVRYTFRAAKDGTEKGGIRITVFPRYDLKDVLRSVEEMRPRLRSLLQRSQATETKEKKNQHIDWDFCIESDCLNISLVKGMRQGFFLHHEAVQMNKDEHTEDVILKPAVMQIVCPPDCDFDAEGRQAMLERAVIEGVRNHAKTQLLPRLLAFAKRYGIKLNEVKINSSKGRWGSCSLHKKGTLFNRQKLYNINLSLFVVLLPMELQKLILLHELTHTLYMDHSAAFHANLDQWLGGKEDALEKELKKYNTSIFSFVKKDAPK
jgi:hypothetical protein